MKIQQKALCLLAIGLTLSACSTGGRYYGGSVTTKESFALHQTVQVNYKTPNDFGGSFYAKVIKVDGNTVYLKGERGTLVSVETNKSVRVGEEVLFVYSPTAEVQGKIFTQQEQEFNHYVNTKRLPR